MNPENEKLSRNRIVAILKNETVKAGNADVPVRVGA
jgi:hypothetical protein